MDANLKRLAMKKAKHQGMTLSAVLNLATKAFVGGELRIGAFERDLLEAREDIKAGRIISQEKLFKHR